RTGSVPSPLAVHLTDGTERFARGRFNAFAWSQTNNHANGQLYSALAALEKWLCSLVDRGVDVAPHTDYLMWHTNNVAVLGVFINAAAQHWTLPEGDKERIEARVRIAHLDYRNYRSGSAEVSFEWPEDLAKDIACFERSKQRAREVLAFPENCRRFLANPAPL